MKELLGFRVRYTYNGNQTVGRFNANQYDEASRYAFVNQGKLFAVYRKRSRRFKVSK